MTDAKKFYTNGEIIKRLYRLGYVFHNIMLDHCILYYASGGTLIGAMRHGGIIPWDNDLDFCIPISSKQIFLSAPVKHAFDKQDYRIEQSVSGWYRIIDKKDKRVTADVFLVQSAKNKEDEWIIQHTGKALQLWPKDTIRMKDLFPLKEQAFGSGIILTPYRPENALTSLYGKSWKKVGYITMDPDEHLDLDEPIKLKVSVFTPAKPFYTRKQIHLEKDNPYLRGITL